MRNFRTLIIWKTGIEIAKEAYLVAGLLPKDERFRIIDQLTRASVSISLNIAEGCSRRSEKEYRHYLSIAMGSAFEVETILKIILELNMVAKAKLEKLIQLLEEEERMLNTIIRKIKISEKS
ncbi:MAG: four helix bundle protein [Chitinophagales bacterium]|jgi:four helix bundle protein